MGRTKKWKTKGEKRQFRKWLDKNKLVCSAGGADEARLLELFRKEGIEGVYQEEIKHGTRA